MSSIAIQRVVCNTSSFGEYPWGEDSADGVRRLGTFLFYAVSSVFPVASPDRLHCSSLIPLRLLPKGVDSSGHLYALIRAMRRAECFLVAAFWFQYSGLVIAVTLFVSLGSFGCTVDLLKHIHH